MAYISKINGYFIKDATARATSEAALQKANAAYALAEGRDTAVVYETFNALKTALLSLDKGALKVGTQLLIKDKNVPDYWISAVNSTASTSAVGSGSVEANGYYEKYTIGYYEISILETAKVDLSGYAETDGTYSGMTVGNATNATNATNDGSGRNIADTYAQKNGTYNNMTVGNAANAGYAAEAGHAASATTAGTATNATNDGGGNNIANTYATKSALNNEKVTMWLDGEHLQIWKGNAMIGVSIRENGGGGGGGSEPEPELPYIISDDGTISAREEGSVSGNLYVPYEVAAVAVDGFKNCGALISVTFVNGDALPDIGDGAFSGCDALESIRFNCTYEEFISAYGDDIERTDSWFADLSGGVLFDFYESTGDIMTKDELLERYGS